VELWRGHSRHYVGLFFPSRNLRPPRHPRRVKPQQLFILQFPSVFHDLTAIPARCPKYQRSRTCRLRREHTNPAQRGSIKLTPLYRTPQNTPASAAPITSHAQQPGVSSIKEGMLLCLDFNGLFVVLPLSLTGFSLLTFAPPFFFASQH
jgi:hypothetical protein